MKFAQIHISLYRVFLLIGLLFSSGCQNFQLGSPAAYTFETLYIRPATNDSFAPQAQALLSGQLRDTFISDGRIRLVTNTDDADAILDVNLTEYDRDTAARDSDDTIIAQDFDLNLTAEISLYNQATGKPYFERRRLIETSNAYVDNPYRQSDQLATQSFLQSEFQAMPRLTRDLARQIADEVLSPW